MSVCARVRAITASKYRMTKSLIRMEPTADWASRMSAGKRLIESDSDTVSDRKRFSIANSSAWFGYPSDNRSVKRLSSTIGNGNVPSISIGFKVVMTKKATGGSLSHRPR